MAGIKVYASWEQNERGTLVLKSNKGIHFGNVYYNMMRPRDEQTKLKYIAVCSLIKSQSQEKVETLEGGKSFVEAKVRFWFSNVLQIVAPEIIITPLKE